MKFTGTPGVSEAALRDRLKLTERDTFDFFRWQDDRDRLEETLKKDAHFEARVSARRSGSPSDGATTVDLEYDVYQGPRTIVDITGIPPNNSLREEIERLWSEAVFDGFLLDEAQERRASGDDPRGLSGRADRHIDQPAGGRDGKAPGRQHPARHALREPQARVHRP